MLQDIEILFPPTLSGRSFQEAIETAQATRRVEPPLGYRERLCVLNGLSKDLMAAGAHEASLREASGLPFLVTFLGASNLEHLVAREVRNPAALERFVPIDGRKSLRLLPKGTVCHWIAGNIPLLGMFSWAVSALAGNVNVIRLSSRQHDFISPMLQRLLALSSAGRRLAEETVLVSFDRDNREANEFMSAAADLRIAWGNADAVESIVALPRSWHCEDVTFGPRVSLAVIDPDLATDRTLSRLASDVVYFDQLACSSPQYLFLKRQPGSNSVDSFLNRFASALAAQCRSVPRHRLDYEETYQIELDRARILLEGGSLKRDDQTQWTIAVVGRPCHQVRCANRFLQVIPFERFESVYACIPENVQTVTTLLSEEDASTFTEEAARRRVCRFPRPGEGNHFESPWDGVPIFTRLTRWVVRTDQRRPDESDPRR